MQYSGITSVGPWDLFEISEWTEQQLKDMVGSLPALPPLNYENLNKKTGSTQEVSFGNTSSHNSHCSGDFYFDHGSSTDNNRFGHL